MKVEQLKNWYENLSLENVSQISDFYTEDAFFKDPFNEFHGRERIEAIFMDMFKTLSDPRFIFLDYIDSDQKVFITWDFVFALRGKEVIIHGSSFLKYENGKINYHRDYWDVGEEVLMKVPFIRKIYGHFRRRLSHDAN